MDLIHRGLRALKVSLEQASKLQRMVEASFIVITLLVTVWLALETLVTIPNGEPHNPTTQLIAERDERRMELDGIGRKKMALKAEAERDAQFEAALAKADVSQKAKLVLVETAKRSSALWGLVAGLSTIVLLCLRFGGSQKKFIVTLQKRGNFNVYVVRPHWPFSRPRIVGNLPGWKVIVAFNGHCYLVDTNGSRVHLPANPSNNVLEVMNSESVVDHLNNLAREMRDIISAGELLEMERDKVQKTAHTLRRMMLLMIEGLRKSKDFQRSDSIKLVRMNLIKLMQERLPTDPIHDELERRDEEESMSAAAH